MTLDYSLVVNVGCCYSGSKKDAQLWKELKKQLAPLIHSQQITLWDSGKINVGQNTTQEIELHIVGADLILLLVSPDFVSSSFGRKQMGLALRQFYRMQIHTIPILLYPCMWELTPIFQLEPLPHNRRPISISQNRGLALLEVAQGIHTVIEKLQMSPRLSRSQHIDVHREFFSIPPLSEENMVVTGSTIKASNIEEFISALHTNVSGMQIHGKYRLAKKPLVPRGLIVQHLPLGIPACTPLSITIDTADCPPKNITTPMAGLITSDGVMLYGVEKGEPLPPEVAGNITIQY